jgi:hypothetical protein
MSATTIRLIGGLLQGAAVGLGVRWAPKPLTWDWMALVLVVSFTLYFCSRWLAAEVGR